MKTTKNPFVDFHFSKARHITRIPLVVTLIIVGLFIIPFGVFVSIYDYRVFMRDLGDIEQLYLTRNEHILRLEIENLFSYIEYRQSRTEKRLREEIKVKVNEAYAIINRLYILNKDKLPDKELQGLIRDTLRDLRFTHGRGYYFILAMDGVEQLYPPDINLEGKNLLLSSDERIQNVAHEMITKAGSEGEGFYSYFWPKLNLQNIPVLKIAFIKLFKPLGWIIGTGEYIEDVDNETRQEVLSVISDTKYPTNHYVCVYNSQGNRLAHSIDAKGDHGYQETKHKDMVQKFVGNINKKDDRNLTFRTYSIASATSSDYFECIGYYENWGWVLTAGTSMEPVKKNIANRKKALISEFKVRLSLAFVLFVIAISIVFTIGHYFGIMVRNSFSAFTDFFKKTSVEYEHIDPERFDFKEFRELSSYANKMVYDRKQSEKLIYTINRRLKEANNRLKKMANVDGLTGLVNRRHFDELVEKEWKRAIRNGENISIGMIDIDFFKLYNDTYGHQQGDDCLKNVAKAIKSSLKRPMDVVARYGGEEFIVFLPDTGLEGAVKLAKEMQENIGGLKLKHEASQADQHVTVSIGIADMLPEEGSKPADLIGRADKALYKAKESGRNRYEIYSEAG